MSFPWQQTRPTDGYKSIGYESLPIRGVKEGRADAFTLTPSPKAPKQFWFSFGEYRNPFFTCVIIRNDAFVVTTWQSWGGRRQHNLTAIANIALRYPGSNEKTLYSFSRHIAEGGRRSSLPKLTILSKISVTCLKNVFNGKINGRYQCGSFKVVREVIHVYQFFRAGCEAWPLFWFPVSVITRFVQGWQLSLPTCLNIF